MVALHVFNFDVLFSNGVRGVVHDVDGGGAGAGGGARRRAGHAALARRARSCRRTAARLLRYMALSPLWLV